MNFIEISPPQYQNIISLLGEYADFPVVNAVIEGNTPGQIFVDQKAEPQSAFVLTDAGFSYLLGFPHNKAFNRKLKEQLDHEIFPRFKVSSDPTLIFYPLSDNWEIPLKRILERYTVHEIFRKQFSFKKSKFKRFTAGSDLIPEGFSLHPINQTWLEKLGADMFPWKTTQIFLEKGFGFWLLARDEEIACECSSVFIGGGAVEINIYTAEKYQQQGLATIAARALINECLVRGIRPNWECWWDNEPSVALAKKMGFEPNGDHPVFLVELI